MWARVKTAIKAARHLRRLRAVRGDDDLPEFGALAGRRRARLLETHDGDTMKVAIVEGGRVRKVTIRVLGVDTPEVRARDPAEKAAGIRARDFVAAWALPAQFSVGGAYAEADLKRAYAEEPVMLDVDFAGRDKYGRALGAVYKPGGQTSLSDELVAAGHAVAYDGGTKASFSKTPVCALADALTESPSLHGRPPTPRAR